MATHSSVLAWRIPGTREPAGLPSMGSHRVGHDWSDLAAEQNKGSGISLTIMMVVTIFHLSCISMAIPPLQFLFSTFCKRILLEKIVSTELLISPNSKNSNLSQTCHLAKDYTFNGIILFIKIKVSSQLIILAPESTCSGNCDPIHHAKISLPQKFLHIPTFTNVNVNVLPPPVSLF